MAVAGRHARTEGPVATPGEDSSHGVTHRTSTTVMPASRRDWKKSSGLPTAPHHFAPVLPEKNAVMPVGAPVVASPIAISPAATCTTDGHPETEKLWHENSDGQSVGTSAGS